jgi:hypothetical protein
MFVQMDGLLRRFKEATSSRYVTICPLEKNNEYPVIKAEWVQTKYGAF